MINAYKLSTKISRLNQINDWQLLKQTIKKSRLITKKSYNSLKFAVSLRFLLLKQRRVFAQKFFKLLKTARNFSERRHWFWFESFLEKLFSIVKFKSSVSLEMAALQFFACPHFSLIELIFFVRLQTLLLTVDDYCCGLIFFKVLNMTWSANLLKLAIVYQNHFIFWWLSLRF